MLHSSFKILKGKILSLKALRGRQLLAKVAVFACFASKNEPQRLGIRKHAASAYSEAVIALKPPQKTALFAGNAQTSIGNRGLNYLYSAVFFMT